RTKSKNPSVWPMNSPSAVKAFIVATAPPVSTEVGRMTETAGNFRLRNGHGSGIIRLVWKSSRPNGGGDGKGGTLRFGNTRLPSVRGARGSETALPALSCQVWKWEVSVGPILSRIRKTCGWVTLWAKVG